MAAGRRSLSGVTKAMGTVTETSITMETEAATASEMETEVAESLDMVMATGRAMVKTMSRAAMAMEMEVEMGLEKIERSSYGSHLDFLLSGPSILDGIYGTLIS